MMTLTLPWSPPQSVELGTKVRAHSSIRGCLWWGERLRGLWVQVDEPLYHRMELMGTMALFLSSHLPFLIRTPWIRGE